MYKPLPSSWTRYPLAGSIAGPLADSGMSRGLPIRPPSGAMACMLGYGSPAVPGVPPLEPARAAAIGRQRIAALARTHRFARRTMIDGMNLEVFILFCWLKI